MKILINGLISKNILKKEGIGIQIIGSISNIKIKELEKVLSQTKLKGNYSMSNNIIDLENCDSFIIFAVLGNAKIAELEKTNDIIQMQNKNIIGLILI